MNARKTANGREKGTPETILKIRKRLWNLRRYLPNILLAAIAAGLHVFLRSGNSHPLALEWTAPGALLLITLSLRLAFEWERVPVLRLGKFSKTKGPGMFCHIPLIDTLVDYVDTRIRVTDFSAEHVLTRDAVPVFVDAVVFWMVWDAGKTKLEVENYEYAVSMSAKTALRDSIGKTPLAAILSDRARLGRELREILDAKTNPWGVTSLSVEIKDIIIPEKLEESLSREAQAEREREARKIIADTENEIAEVYRKASEKYTDNNEAIQLRSLNLLTQALRESGSMILLPSDVPSLMNKATAAALAKTRKPDTPEIKE